MHPDRRKTRRYQVTGDRRLAQLRLPGQSVDVTLVDESAGGFAIDTSEALGVWVGQIVLLRTLSGWTQSRVVRISPEGMGTRVGLQRIRDLGLIDDAEVDETLALRRELDGVSSRGTKFLLLALGLMIAAAASPTAWRYLYARQENAEAPRPTKHKPVVSSAVAGPTPETPQPRQHGKPKTSPQAAGPADGYTAWGGEALTRLADSFLGRFQPNSATAEVWCALEANWTRTGERMRQAADPSRTLDSFVSDPVLVLTIPIELGAYLQEHDGAAVAARLQAIRGLDRLGEALDLSPEQRSRIGELISALDDGLAGLSTTLTTAEPKRLVFTVGRLLDDAESALEQILTPGQWSLWRGFEPRSTARPTTSVEQPAS